ncbi:uncharacterized protein [Blastocystis hominis]|uniref:methionine--tRNA ligase n=1 Tax=Blastocystis hominis TaxID=12968 RepID=D8MBL2_BLAHO|nr:uncharacterized protein [Blastocystis hominis]CBK25451.2 unnamed protein product [Blastocystis hominis]|eukprot:XP_012899499.1 uncharacterized protein [Blastocystis hominis]
MKYVKRIAALAVLSGDAPKNAPTFIGTSILVAQKSCPKTAPKPAGAATAKAPAAKADKKQFASAATAVATEKRKRIYDSREILPVAGEQNILITSALPYVNNVPHLGNLIGCVLSADVFARYCRERGLNTLYVCGTDEYGTATETRAQADHMTPREICNKFHAIHRAVYDWFDIHFDFFGRTSTEDPRKDTQIAQGIFKRLCEEDQLVEQEIEQVYCHQCGRFLADRFIEGTCPICGYPKAGGDQCDKCGNLLNATELVNPVCKVGGPTHKVENRVTKHLFLNLPKLEPELRAWVAATSVANDWSSNAINITNGWIENGLKPRCITRDLKWGTPVPREGYEDKVFYVWFDAPIGYISITANYTKEWKQWWQNPKDVKLVQFMGKDNIPFHTVIFPSTLIGTRDPWTKVTQISCTEYLNYEDGKFSKSQGTGVFGDQAKDTNVPSEVWRFYLLSNRPEQSDSAFYWEDLAEKNNNELLKNLGNFVHRCLSFVYNRMDATVPPCGAKTEREQKLIEAVNETLQKYNEAMMGTHLKAGLKWAMEISRLGNQYLQDAEPWTVLKSDPEQCGTICYVAVNLVYLISNVFEPFMPGFSDKVCYQLNFDHGKIPDVFEEVIPAGHKINKILPIFKKIEPEEIKAYREKFGGKSN